ncbi:Hypothetical predicted protein [Olea europaea subsp. europaea]|uniref:Uncharacterized protein n=1 Tax=Olea europaea subsp. europaea TaxID=158383 RepID=A0A8S0UR49_OLEEU|nr:Hypothetical predicted protein [Olea europaea subsp. europaea]CAA3021138.1 Hypothetical predicted protein [Olea europaea subsp. europaea]
MGIIGSSFAVMVGMIGGVYIAQKYEVPNIRNMVETAACKAKVVEETYRKPNATTPCKYWKAKAAEETHRQPNTATACEHLEE